MRILVSLVIGSLVLLCGCSTEHFTQGHGDASQFILQHAVAYGGHPITTNSLPTVGGDWQYVQDEFGVAVQLPASQYQAARSFVQSAFGPPSNSAGWSVRDFGVAIMVQKIGSKAVVSVYPPMSDEKQVEMWQKIDEMVQKNTK